MPLRVLILAGGDSTRWADHLGVRKHLIPILGEPLIHRTVRLLHELHVYDVRIVCRVQDQFDYVPPGAQWTLMRTVDREWEQEQESSRHAWSPDGRTLILYGDCYFTAELLAAMVRNLVPDWRVYGRWVGSTLTGKTYGEMWGWLFRPEHHAEIDAARSVAIAAREDGVTKRCLGWEVLRAAYGYDLNVHGQSPPRRFVEWEDATDDFDFPVDWDIWSELNRDLWVAA